MSAASSNEANVVTEDPEEWQATHAEELEVLESIYPEYISSPSRDNVLKLEVPVEFGDVKSIEIYSTPSGETPVSHTVSLNALPPFQLHLRLPLSYPLWGPPEVMSMRAMHHWLPEISNLQQLLLDMWQAGDPVLYTWVQYLQSGDFLQKLNLLSPDGETVRLPHPAPNTLAPLLIAYDISSKSNQFSQNSYPCSICMTWLKGSKCLQLICHHIFCRECLEDFWKLCIEEGDVGRVGCPDPDCVKKGSEAGEEEVARVVTDGELQRWKWLREKRNVDRDPTVVHCPVAVCQAPVSKPSDSDSESNWSRLRQCTQCGFYFCAFCKRTWHGPLDKCPIAQYEDLALEYLGAEDGSPERAKLERRFGRANIRRLVATYEEEKANLQWLSSSTMMCPGCQCHVEKTLGCNHMTCWKCHQHFCYRCGDRLNAAQPYAHFSRKGTGCFNQLFDEVDNEENEWEPMVDDEV